MHDIKRKNFFNMKKELIKIFKRYATESYVHGLPKIFKSEKNLIVRSIWLTCIIASLGFCAFLLYTNIFDFLGYEVTTKIQIFNEIPKVFPRVVICNNSPFVTNFAKTFLEQVRSNLKGIESDDLFFIQRFIPPLAAFASNSTIRRALGYNIQVHLSYKLINNGFIY